MTLIALILVWYGTKLYYSHKFTLDLKDGWEGERIVCYKCGKIVYIEQIHIRNPYYCYDCR